MRKLATLAAVAALATGFGVGQALGATLVVDDDGMATAVDCDAGDATNSTVQGAIDAASEGDTILVCPGTYTQDLTIFKNNLKLKGSGSATTIIEGVLTGDAAIPGFPTAFPNIDLQGNDVSIQGFTVRSPASTDGRYASGIVLDGVDIIIKNNAFEVSSGDPGSVGIQTWALGNGSQGLDDISGLIIMNNTFTSLAPDSTFGYEAIFINPQNNPVATNNPVTIFGNTFSGDMYRAVYIARDEGNVIGNTICTDLDATINTDDFGPVPVGVRVNAGAVVDVNVLVHDNVIGVDCEGNFDTGINISSSAGIGTVGENNVDHAELGVWLRDGADGWTVNNNSIGHSGTDGILIDSDDNTVFRNTPHHGGNDGIDVNGDDNTFTGNNSHHNFDCAYEDNGTSNTFSTSGSDRNKAKKNGDNGIPGTTCS